MHDRLGSWGPPIVIWATDGDGFDGWPPLKWRTRRGDNFPSVAQADLDRSWLDGVRSTQPTLGVNSEYDPSSPKLISHRQLMWHTTNNLVTRGAPLWRKWLITLARGVLQSGTGGLIGLWPPRHQTWHFSQIFGPPPTLGHRQTVW